MKVVNEGGARREPSFALVFCLTSTPFDRPSTCECERNLLSQNPSLSSFDQR